MTVACQLCTAKMTTKPTATTTQDSWTLFLLYSVCIFSGADTAMLSSSFHALEVTVGLTPSQLATLSFSQALVSSAMTPFWGVVIDSGVSVKKVLAGGMFVWALTAFLMGTTSSFSIFLLLKSINGFAISAQTPVSQVVICNVTPAEQRGWYFGLAQCAHQVGAIAACIIVTNIAGRDIYVKLPFSTIWVVDGWRVTFVVIAGLCFIMCLVIASSSMDVDHHREHALVPLTLETVVCRPFVLLKKFWQINTFKIIVMQGLFGSAPWSALAFTTMYFQYSGFTDWQASLVVAALGIGGAIGGVLGGEVADRLARWSPFHGRALAAQISVVGCMPLLFVAFGGTSASLPFTTVLVTMLAVGLIGSWCGGGVNRPILTEIVPREHWSTVLSWTVALDGSFAAVFGAPLVGILVERYFGYQRSNMRIDLMPERLREANSAALSKAMLCCTVLPFAVCAIFYSMLHVTYYHDIVVAQTERASLRSSLRDA